MSSHFLVLQLFSSLPFDDLMDIVLAQNSPISDDYLVQGVFVHGVPKISVSTTPTSTSMFGVCVIHAQGSGSPLHRDHS